MCLFNEELVDIMHHTWFIREEIPLIVGLIYRQITLIYIHNHVNTVRSSLLSG